MPSWTVNPPIKVLGEVVPVRRGRLQLRLKVRFQDDTVPPNVYPPVGQDPIEFISEGKGAYANIREKVRVARQTLDEGELPPADGETFSPADDPVPITPKAEDIRDIQNLVQEAGALEAYAKQFSISGTDNLPGTTLTLNGRRAVLKANIGQILDPATGTGSSGVATWGNVRNKIMRVWEGFSGSYRAAS